MNFIRDPDGDDEVLALAVVLAPDEEEQRRSPDFFLSTIGVPLLFGGDLFPVDLEDDVAGLEALALGVAARRHVGDEEAASRSGTRSGGPGLGVRAVTSIPTSRPCVRGGGLSGRVLELGHRSPSAIFSLPSRMILSSTFVPGLMSAILIRRSLWFSTFWPLMLDDHVILLQAGLVGRGVRGHGIDQGALRVLELEGFPGVVVDRLAEGC